MKSNAPTLAQSPTAAFLVWGHYAHMKSTRRRQVELIPASRAEVTTDTRAKYKGLLIEANGHYHNRGSAIVDFILGR